MRAKVSSAVLTSLLIVLAGFVLAASEARPVLADVRIEKVVYLKLPNCYRLSNGTVEAIVTTDVGPRVIRYGFAGGQNALAEMPDAVVKTQLGDWKPRGGHRLWTAPEQMPRSYAPDNSPIQFRIEGRDTIRLMQPVEPKTGIGKEMIVTLDATGSRLTVRHRIINKNLWPIDVAPWALTIMNGTGAGGTTVIPQEPYRSHDESLLPARPLALWHYTDLSDSRWSIGPKFIRLKTLAARDVPQKIGMANKQGWAAYHRDDVLFVKRFPYREGAHYPDYGSNCETYTSGSFMEVETLGPLARVEPDAATEHTEQWYLFRNVQIGATEASVSAALTPLLAQTTPLR